MIHGSFYHFVRLFQLCDLAWKSSRLQNKICSIGQIFFMTFQFQVPNVNFWHHFGSFLEFFDYLEPNFSFIENCVYFRSTKCEYLDGSCLASPRWVSLLVAEIYYPDATFPNPANANPSQNRSPVPGVNPPNVSWQPLLKLDPKMHHCFDPTTIFIGNWSYFCLLSVF